MKRSARHAEKGHEPQRHKDHTMPMEKKKKKKKNKKKKIKKKKKKTK